MQKKNLEKNISFILKKEKGILLKSIKYPYIYYYYIIIITYINNLL